MQQLPIDIPLDQITAFCNRWGIAELALFGSILTDNFRPDSDVDVLVTFRQPKALPDREAMRRELEAIVGRDVDLVYRRVIEATENYLLRHSILDSARVIYAA
ncbi:MAG: nucleotidyltransferase domain-containing protein [Anaerolineae bacterium]|nr:nucleotidyltransferase domain-containing protein [Anaerolineae bacterium]